MATYPLTRDEIIAELDRLEMLIQTYGDDPALCAKLTQGSVSVDIPGMIDRWRERQKDFRQQLADYPTLISTDAI